MDTSKYKVGDKVWTPRSLRTTTWNKYWVESVVTDIDYVYSRVQVQWLDNLKKCWICSDDEISCEIPSEFINSYLICGVCNHSKGNHMFGSYTCVENKCQCLNFNELKTDKALCKTCNGAGYTDRKTVSNCVTCKGWGFIELGEIKPINNELVNRILELVDGVNIGDLNKPLIKD